VGGEVAGEKGAAPGGAHVQKRCSYKRGKGLF